MPDGSELAVDAAIEACVAEWRGGGLARSSATLGLGIDDAIARQLARALAGANKKRTLYTLSLADVVRVLVEARGSEIAVRHAGQGGPFARTPSTIALAVRIDDVVHVALGTSEAREPSPRTAWQLLTLWDTDLVKNLARARAWITREPTRVTIPVVARLELEPNASVAVRGALRAEVLARTREDEPRLVYADALTARGDPLGEFIVVQCAIAAGNTDPKLVKRELVLRRRYGASWLRQAKQYARDARLRRGFVASVTMTARQFAKAGALFEAEPIEELVLVGSNPSDLTLLAAAPHFTHLDTLTISDPLWIPDSSRMEIVRDFLRTLPNLRVLHLRAAFSTADPKMGWLFDGVVWPSLERLQLAIGEGGQEWLQKEVCSSLCRAEIPKLKELAIAPFGHERELSAAFPAATIRPL